MFFWSTLNKLNVSRICRKLIQHRIYRDPVSEPDLGPCVIVECAIKIDDTRSDTSGNSSGASQGCKQNCMLVTVPLLTAQSFEGGRYTNSRFFVERNVSPIE